MKLILSILITLSITGCYKTRVGVERPGVATHEDHQWFALFGSVPISNAVTDCPDGVSYVEAQQDGMDMAIGFGLSLAGGLVAAAVCELDSDPTEEQARAYSECVALGGVAGTLLARRTVTYQCSGPAAAPPQHGADF
jgi:hypothetical protein